MMKTVLIYLIFAIFSFTSAIFGMDVMRLDRSSKTQLKQIEQLRLTCYHYCDELDAELSKNEKGYCKPVAVLPSKQFEVYERNIIIHFYVQDALQKIIPLLVFGASGDWKILNALNTHHFNHPIWFGLNSSFYNQMNNLQVFLYPLNQSHDSTQANEYLRILRRVISLSTISNGYIDHEEEKNDQFYSLKMFIFLIQELMKNPQIWSYQHVAEFLWTLHGNLLNHAANLKLELLVHTDNPLFQHPYFIMPKYSTYHCFTSYLALQIFNAAKFKGDIPLEIITVILKDLMILQEIGGSGEITHFDSFQSIANYNLSNGLTKLLSPKEIFDCLAQRKSRKERKGKLDIIKNIHLKFWK